MDIALELLRASLDHPWESIDQIVREHAADWDALGDPAAPGTGAWHFRHIVEIFRLHARTATGGEVCPEPDPPIPVAPTEIRAVLRAEVEAFIEWARRQPQARWRAKFVYGTETDLIEMLGIMSRHIVWHAAAVHYYRKWKSPR